MRSAVICYAPDDLAAAEELGAYLELNCPVAVYYDEGRIREGHDLIQAAERAISADIAIVLLSPASMPRAWVRSRWEPVFLKQAEEFGSYLACVLLGACPFPDLLRRKNFYDFASRRLEAKRSLKRALLDLDKSPRETVILPALEGELSLEPERLDALQTVLGDRPASEIVDAGTARQFAHACAQDFAGVFWIDCRLRSRTGILGDAGEALGLLLAGSPEQNRRDLIAFASDRRCLFIFHEMAAEERGWFELGGRCSTIFTPAGRERRVLPLVDAVALFSRWTTEADACLRALGDAEFHVRRLSSAGSDDWEAIVQLGTAAVSLLKHRERLAEAYEMLDLMASACRAAGDVTTVYRLAWEQRWILERWGDGEPVRIPSLPPQHATQLAFPWE